MPTCRSTQFSFRPISGNSETTRASVDKSFVSRFLKDAEEILKAAAMTAETEISILIHPRGGIHLVTGKEDWPLESLLAESGAAAAYRVSRHCGQVLVEGRSQSESCMLRRRASPAVLRELLPEKQTYQVLERSPYGSEVTAIEGAWCGNGARMLLT